MSLDYDRSVSCQNRRGEWVHYARDHILGKD